MIRGWKRHSSVKHLSAGVLIHRWPSRSPPPGRLHAGPPPLPTPALISDQRHQPRLPLKAQSPGFNQSSEGDTRSKGGSPLIQPTSATLAAACRAVYYQQTAHPGLEYSAAETPGAGRWVRNRGERKRERNANERRLSSLLLASPPLHQILHLLLWRCAGPAETRSFPAASGPLRERRLRSSNLILVLNLHLEVH